MSTIKTTKQGSELQEAWKGFTTGEWTEKVNVRVFIISNVTPYTGDDSFLTEPTGATDKLWRIVSELTRRERGAFAKRIAMDHPE